MKRLLALCGFFPLVWVKDSCSLRLLRAKLSPFGGWIAADHELAHGGYLVGSHGTLLSRDTWKWVEWKHNRVHVTFPEG